MILQFWPSQRLGQLLTTNLRRNLGSFGQFEHHRNSRPIVMDAHKRHSSVLSYDMGSKCRVTLSDDGASFSASLPGWSSRDINAQLPRLHEAWHLRGWQVLATMDWIREAVKKSSGFLDLIKYEQSHLTYYKCVDLERVVSVHELESLGGLPYQYGTTMDCFLSRVGKTSFQLNNILKVTDTGVPLYQSSLVSVAVDAESRQVAPHPDWWVKKFGSKVQERPALRINLPRAHPEENLLVSSPMIVQPLDLDYYGHTTNTSYFFYAANGIFTAQRQNKLTITPKDLELSIKRIQLDYVSDCSCGDQLDTKVFKDAEDKKALLVILMKGDKVIYTQKFEYEKDVVFSQKL